jgi:hypothetical protein
MLTDIFATRYSKTVIWEAFGELERKLLVQCFRILNEQICPYWVDGKESSYAKEFWNDIHSRVSMELGQKSLSALVYQSEEIANGQTQQVAKWWPINMVCENWMTKSYDPTASADEFMKERISLVELGFRRFLDKSVSVLTSVNANSDNGNTNSLAILAGHSPKNLISDIVDKFRVQTKQRYESSVEELNRRFLQAGCRINYHNGFIQMTSDLLLEDQLEKPFWSSVAEQKWSNVDHDMKQAIDLRDNNGRDPAFYAARALESALKIISDEKRWTHGGEKGAHNYIDNLASKTANFIADWESRGLKGFFTEVRNPLGHGPGKKPIHSLNFHQTNWAIETCMTWIKSLVLRM